MIFFKKVMVVVGCWWDWEKNCRKNSDRASLVGIRLLVYFFGLITWRMTKICDDQVTSKWKLKGGLDKGVGRENLTKIFIDLPPPPISYNIMQETVQKCTIAV